MSALTSLYERVPAPVRSLMATARGWQLRRSRYGADTERLTAEALERDSWDEARWQAWREERLARLLHRAATRVPYYRAHWEERRRRGDTASFERLENWPILGKPPLREKAEAFLADDVDPRKMIVVETSGTTGTPVKLYRSHRTERDWYSIFEARLRRWNGVTLRDRWAHHGGARVVPGGRRVPPFWVWNAALRQLYLSSYHATPDAAPAYVDAMRRYRVAYMLGYPSAMHSIARTALERGIEAPRLAVVISNAERLYDFQRAAIEKAYGCRVQNTYGQGEISCAASECAHGTMHLWPDVGVTEWLRDDGDAPVEPGSVGRLVVSGLINSDMPLIRYAIGDRAARPAGETRCACGRKLPVLGAIEGRTADVILTPAGSPVGGLDTIFHSGLPMREAQIVQETLYRIRINVVPAPGFGPAHADDMRQGIRERLGDGVEVLVDEVDSIPRTPAGKFQVQKSLISAAQLR